MVKELSFFIDYFVLHNKFEISLKRVFCGAVRCGQKFISNFALRCGLRTLFCGAVQTAGRKKPVRTISSF